MEEKLIFLENSWENNVRDFLNSKATISELPARIEKAEIFCVSTSLVLKDQIASL